MGVRSRVGIMILPLRPNESERPRGANCGNTAVGISVSMKLALMVCTNSIAQWATVVVATVEAALVCQSSTARICSSSPWPVILHTSSSDLPFARASVIRAPARQNRSIGETCFLGMANGRGEDTGTLPFDFAGTTPRPSSLALRHVALGLAQHAQEFFIAGNFGVGLFD